MKDLTKIILVGLISLGITGCSRKAEPYILPNGKKVFGIEESSVSSPHRQFIFYTKSEFNTATSGNFVYDLEREDLYARGIVDSISYEKNPISDVNIVQSARGGTGLIAGGNVSQNAVLTTSSLHVRFRTDQGKKYNFNVVDGEGSTKESVYESIKQGDSVKVRTLRPQDVCGCSDKVEEVNSNDSIEAWEIEKI
jgi:hypothetical protein